MYACPVDACEKGAAHGLSSSKHDIMGPEAIDARQQLLEYRMGAI